MLFAPVVCVFYLGVNFRGKGCVWNFITASVPSPHQPLLSPALLFAKTISDKLLKKMFGLLSPGCPQLRVVFGEIKRYSSHFKEAFSTCPGRASGWAELSLNAGCTGVITG